MSEDEHHHHQHQPMMMTVEDTATTPTTDDFLLDHDPSKPEKLEMKKASKRPSEWLKLLCKDWALENFDLVEATDSKFLDYKPYLKGYLSSQLLCRLSIPPATKDVDTPLVDFWGICGIQDEFDKAYIIAQIERFCSLYNIRGTNAFDDGVDAAIYGDLNEHAATVAAAAAAANGNLMPFMNDATAAAVAAAAASDVSKLTKKQASEVSKAHRIAKDAEKALEQERRQNMKREQRRLSQERKEQKVREREAIAVRKAAERIARENSREERRRKKLDLRAQREKFAHEQKEAALKRAAELVASNRVPIEITRGAAAAKAAASAAIQQSSTGVGPEAPGSPVAKKSRSAIVVSTAADLNQIVTHAKNLWAKYNAIAKEHNQKVNWITVAKELGIHVKVREKYARMHSRAEQRGFDWENHGHWKIKDHPDIFLEPTQAEQKAKMPPPPPDCSTTVLISEDNKEVGVPPSVATDEAAVAAAAAVVDAAGVSGAPVVPTTHDEQTTAAAVAATLVADPTANLVKVDATEATMV